MTTAEHSFPVAHPFPVESSVARLRRARERFLTGRPLPDGVPDEVTSAWRRARFFGVRHDAAWPVPAAAGKDTALDDTDDPVRPSEPAPLLVAARPALERIAPSLGGGRSALVLTDERLRVLWSAGGGADGTRGGDLDERRVGHNSAALALRTGRRAEVHGPEHFLDVWQDVSAVSVPVRDPAGRARGTVTVAAPLCADDAPHPGAALAEAVAALAEAGLAARSRPAERVLLDAYLAAARGENHAVVAFGGHSRLVSPAAARLLSPADLQDLERGTLAELRNSGHAASGKVTQTASDPAGTHAVHFPSGVSCTAGITPVRHLGSAVGAVAVLEPLAHASSRTAGRTPITLAGRSVPWRRATERAAELAAHRAPLLLAGERGTGKAALARELLGDPLILDAAEGLLGDALALPPRNRPLVVRHAERLAQPDVAVLNRLLDDHPDAPLVVTYTPGTPPGPCLQRLLDSVSARSVTLPALRERPEDIEALLPAVTPRPAAGHPPLTWTLDALRALERYPWHGNVTELAHVVRSLAVHRRATGPVRRAELPDPVRQGPADRPLSPMEQAERTAILEALRRHGGNKARTAAALGIGRATLYRKLRSYRG
ncbi:helix-turn-helix domain-containing protein [Streptomyces viridiviolaceus]